MFLLILVSVRSEPSPKSFTFHNVSINTNSAQHILGGTCLFTFHNVSINTVFAYPFLQSIRTLHSTMFLLIQIADNVFPFSVVSLHSTMFLLIRAFRWWLRPLSCFTFHNVSINTYLSVKSLMCAPFFTFHNVSINTHRRFSTPLHYYLYIPQCFY